MSAAILEAAAWPHRVVPGAADGAVILALHGTGADEHDLLALAELVAPGRPVLSPRGPVKEGHANRWFRRFAEGRFDLPDVERRAGELAAWLDAAKAEHGLAGRKVVALGFSNGANIAAALLLRHPGVLAGAVLLRGQATLDATGATAAGMPVLLVSGAADPIVPARESARLADALRKAGAALDHRVVPADHGLTQQDVALAKAFLA
ncbi:MAG: alpha/beta hydrolase [Acetobacteraceae bacterium]|nr:alpha/beta hydrolase [Acetobacteraceae bacterium]